MIERGDEEFEECRILDPVHVAVGELLAVIVEATQDGSEARRKAMTAVLECQRQIVAALRIGPTLN
jgi:hypothetical protein